MLESRCRQASGQTRARIHSSFEGVSWQCMASNARDKRARARNPASSSGKQGMEHERRVRRIMSNLGAFQVADSRSSRRNQTIDSRYEVSSPLDWTICHLQLHDHRAETRIDTQMRHTQIHPTRLEEANVFMRNPLMTVYTPLRSFRHAVSDTAMAQVWLLESAR